MKKLLLGVCALVLPFVATGCTTSLPVTNTGTPHEYVVVARNSASVFSSLEEAQKEAESKAMSYCTGMGKVYVKKYAMDRPMALGQIPESSLYFTCSNPKEEITTPKTTTTNETSNSMKKLEDLNTMLKKGLITQEEYNTKKQEILKNM